MPQPMAGRRKCAPTLPLPPPCARDAHRNDAIQVFRVEVLGLFDL